MSMYLIFFGKSQDFTIQYYDREQPIEEFNSIIKDFDLLESKIFTVDDIKNKEILSRYFFRIQKRNFCLLKLYSFAQAYNGNRIAGSIFGVGLLSENAIDLNSANFDLLRVAKDNFAKLSLDGAKFNKSNFSDDTDRIWRAIINSNKGNLLDKVITKKIGQFNADGPIAFYVKTLFNDAAKLNDRIARQDIVYFSEDLDHLKRTQAKWGEDNFSIFWEQNTQFVKYKELTIPAPNPQVNNPIPHQKEPIENNDISRLKSALSDSQYKNNNLLQDIEKLNGKLKKLKYTLYALSFITLILLLYTIFRSADNDKIATTTTTQEIAPTNEPISNNTQASEQNLIDTNRLFINGLQFIYSYDVQNQIKDSNYFYSSFKTLERMATQYHYDLGNAKEAYRTKCSEIRRISKIK